MTALPSTGSQRLHWIDLLRGLAVLGVLVFHLTAAVSFEAAPTALLWFSSALQPFRMPALMFASGMLLPLALRKDRGSYFWGKVSNLAWPWLLWTLLLLPLAGDRGDGAGDPLWWVNYHGSVHTWFLVAVFAAYCFAWPVRRVHPALVAMALLALSLALSGAEGWLWFVELLARMGAFFFAGATFVRQAGEASRIPWLALGVGAVATLSWAAFSVKAGGIGSSGLTQFAMSTVGVLTVAGLLARMPRSRWTEPLEWIGRHSVVPYLVHWPLYLFMLQHTPVTAGWVGFGLMFASTLVISYLLVKAWPVTRALFMVPRTVVRGAP